MRTIDRTTDFLVDVAAVVIAALLVIVAGGRLLNSATAQRLETVPGVGSVVGGLRSLWAPVYHAPAA